jgi:hypothetical protein
LNRGNSRFTHRRRYSTAKFWHGAKQERRVESARLKIQTRRG